MVIQLFSGKQIQYFFLKILDFSNLVQFLVLQLNSQVKHTLSLLASGASLAS